MLSYYAYLPRLPHCKPSGNFPRQASCSRWAAARRRALQLDTRPGSPWLEGQIRAYVKAHLQAFAVKDSPQPRFVQTVGAFSRCRSRGIAPPLVWIEFAQGQVLPTRLTEF